MRILITSGGTEEPIDGVRYITNFSSGKTGAALADRLTERGHEVTLLHNKRAVLPQLEMECQSYSTFEELHRALQDLLSSGEFQAVIHNAAVSDFSVHYMETDSGVRIEAGGNGKISSDEGLHIHLKRNVKILTKLKEYHKGNDELIVVGFKLTNTDSIEEMDEAVKKQLSTGKVDFTVHNNLKDIRGTKHPARLFSRKGELLFKTETKEDMAGKLHQILQGAMQ